MNFITFDFALRANNRLKPTQHAKIDFTSKAALLPYPWALAAFGSSKYQRVNKENQISLPRLIFTSVLTLNYNIVIILSFSLCHPDSLYQSPLNLICFISISRIYYWTYN